VNGKPADFKDGAFLATVKWNPNKSIRVEAFNPDGSKVITQTVPPPPTAAAPVAVPEKPTTPPSPTTPDKPAS